MEINFVFRPDTCHCTLSCLCFPRNRLPLSIILSLPIDVAILLTNRNNKWILVLQRIAAFHLLTSNKQDLCDLPFVITTKLKLLCCCGIWSVHVFIYKSFYAVTLLHIGLCLNHGCVTIKRQIITKMIGSLTQFTHSVIIVDHHRDFIKPWNNFNAKLYYNIVCHL